ncbi:MAG: phosphate ABC transporter ATP-binding protein [Desulfobacterales bacterium]
MGSKSIPCGPIPGSASGFKLEARGLSRVVSGKPLLQGIDLGIPRRETLAVIGPSGSGKSTLLRLLNRLDEPTAGTVFLDGTDYREIPPRELRRRVGMVMQSPHLFPGTVADNVGYGPRQRNAPLSESDIEALLERVGLAGYASREVSHLSGGEAQRVSLARTLANDPEVLLLDEPTSALDDEAERGIEALVRDITRGRSMTCVIVTHDLPQAARLADRVAILDAGRVKALGSPQEVIHGK